MKKMCCGFLILVLLVTLVGCSKPEQTSEEPAGTTKVSQEVPNVEPKEVVTLEWYHGGTPQENEEKVFEEMNKIMEEKIGVRVNHHFVDWNNYSQQMSMLLTSGTEIDMMFTSNWANDFYSDVSKGAYQALNFDMIQEFGPNIVAEVPAGAWDAAKIGGDLYAIPNVQVQARWPALLLQKKYVDKYNFDVNSVNKLADFTPLLESVAKNEDGIYPIDVRKNTGMLSFYLSKMGLEYFGETNPFGIYINDKNLETVNIYETPEMEEFLAVLRDWYKAGIIRPDAASVSDMTAEKQNGKIAAMFAVNNPDTLVNQARLMNMAPEELVMVPLSDPYLATSSIVATMTAINARSTKVEECIKVLNLMFDQEDTRLMNLMSFGIEGENYKKVEDDLIEIIPNTGYYVDMGWSYGTLFNCYRTNPLQPEWRPLGPEINSTATVSPMIGFSLDSTPIKSELAQISAVMDEFIPALLTGSVEPSEIMPEFLNKLEASGADKVQKEIQKQLDAWK